MTNLKIAAALSASVLALATAPAFADACLIDTNYNGTATANVDTTQHAVGNVLTGRLACGNFANADSGASVAIGPFANANGSGGFNTALGDSSSASGTATASTTVGANAGSVGNADVALGYAAGAIGNAAIAIGAQASTLATGTQTNGNIAIGGRSVDAFGSGSGLAATANGGGAVAIGTSSTATGNQSTAVGLTAIASGSDTAAYGANARAAGNASAALGSSAQAFTTDSTAVGAGAYVSGVSGTALGRASTATGFETTALGRGSLASGGNSFAAGAGAVASGNAALAFGSNNVASADGTTAIGTGAQALGTNSTAIGRAAYSGFAGSTAVGFGAVTTKANQVRLGTTSTSVSIADIGYSDSQQSGPEFFLTIDASGTVGKGAQSSAALLEMGSQLSTLQTQQALIDDTVATHTTQIGQLFNLADVARKEARRGIAAAAAIANAPFPSAPGKTSYTANSAIYRGEVAFSASISHRLDTGSPFALTAAVSHSGGKDTVARVGVAGEF